MGSDRPVAYVTLAPQDRIAARAAQQDPAERVALHLAEARLLLTQQYPGAAYALLADTCSGASIEIVGVHAADRSVLFDLDRDGELDDVAPEDFLRAAHEAGHLLPRTGDRYRFDLVAS